MYMTGICSLCEEISKHLIDGDFCEDCYNGAHEIPRRLTGRFVDYDSERVYLLHCRQCGLFWLDPSIKKLKPYRLKNIYLHPSMDEEE